MNETPNLQALQSSRARTIVVTSLIDPLESAAMHLLLASGLLGLLGAFLRLWL